jgi:hypothetical protein
VSILRERKRIFLLSWESRGFVRIQPTKIVTANRLCVCLVLTRGSSRVPRERQWLKGGGKCGWRGAQSRIGRLAQNFGSRARLPRQDLLNRTFSHSRGYCEHDLSTNGLDPESNLACFGQTSLLLLSLVESPSLGSELLKWGKFERSSARSHTPTLKGDFGG